MVKRKIGRVKGRLCSPNKKELMAYACSIKRKCRPVKVGKAVVAGKVRGAVYCCKKGLSRVRSARRKGRHLRYHRYQGGYRIY